MNSSTGNPETHAKIDFCGGVGIRQFVVKNLFVSSGLYYVRSRYRYFYAWNPYLLGYTEYHGQYRYTYLQAPVNIGYKFNVRDLGNIWVSGGLLLSYALTGRVNMRIIDEKTKPYVFNKNEKIMLGNSSSDQIKPFDMAAMIEIGYETPMGIFINADYAMGWKNVSTLNSTICRRRALSVSLGYIFHL